jgi:SRSO17 transposase
VLNDLPRKHCETIAAAVAGPSTARFPPLCTDATWEPQAFDQPRVTAWVAPRPPQGLLGLDDTGLPKQGRRAGGVARPYAGPFGPVAQGPGGVRAHESAEEPTSRAPVPGPLTAPLALPEAWATAQARRATGQVPTAGALQTQPARARALVAQARAWGVPCASGVADAGSGDTPTVVHGLADRQGASVGGLSSPVGVRLPEEGHAAARGQPQQPRPAPREEAQAVRAAWAADRGPPLPWRAPDAVGRRPQGAAGRVPGATGGAPCSTRHHRVGTGPEGGWLGERPGPGARGAGKWYGRTLLADTPLHRLAELAHRRWPIAPC